MERRDQSGLAVFVTNEALVAGTTCTLGEDEARHLKVRRIDLGAVIGLRNGEGAIAEGTLVKVAKQGAMVEVSLVEHVPPPSAVHLLVPVADRDRLLWLAEKVTELGLTSWRPVLWKRSRSVSPRGEGVTFQAKVRARMQGAMAQSHGAWMPQLFPEATIDRAISAAPDGSRLVLDAGGAALVGGSVSLREAPTTIAIGPEGGFEADELEALQAAGFVPVSLGHTILRFETAAIVALGVLRSAQG